MTTDIMKRCSSVYILIAFAGIIIVLLLVILFAYKPHFSETLSNDNADWGDFGQFFWGLGTMLLTALSVWVLFSVNSSLNEFNENLQKKQHAFELELEERRLIAQKEILAQKRINYWQEEYHQIILQLIPGGVKSDAEWLNTLRRVTILYKSMQAEKLLGVNDDALNISSRMDDINKFILVVINETNNARGIKTKNDYMLKYIVLNMLIFQLYFDVFKFKDGDVKIELNDVFPDSEEQNTKKYTTK